MIIQTKHLLLKIPIKSWLMYLFFQLLETVNNFGKSRNTVIWACTLIFLSNKHNYLCEKGRTFTLQHDDWFEKVII